MKKKYFSLLNLHYKAMKRTSPTEIINSDMLKNIIHEGFE